MRDLDTFCLCSDGLSNKVRPDEIQAAIDQSGSLKEACDLLIDTANERGGEDNITVLIAQVSGGRLRPAEAMVEERATAPMSGDLVLPERWGADTLPRDPNLPAYVDHELLDDEETTIPPEEEATLSPEEDVGSRSTEKLEGEG